MPKALDLHLVWNCQIAKASLQGSLYYIRHLQELVSFVHYKKLSLGSLKFGRN